jgi:hypothetical protein
LARPRQGRQRRGVDLPPVRRSLDGDLSRRLGANANVSARTRELVLAKRAEALEDVRNQAPTRFDRSTTVAALADWWLVNVASTQVRASYSRGTPAGS